MTEWFDSHAHYEDAAYEEDRDECLAALYAAGVHGVVNAAQDLRTTYAGMHLAAQYPYIYCTAGIHPHEAEKATEQDYRELLTLSAPENAAHNRIVAIGETGLDYHYDLSPRDVQQENFIRNIRIALQNHLPLVVHDREAHEDTLRILLQERAFDTRVMLHCFSGSAEFARILTQKGCFFSFGGAVTFKNARKFPEVLHEIPEDRLMLETDAPYMTPEPHRGTRNTSAYIPLIAARIAEIYGKREAEIASITTANVKRFFGI